jgi:hypothetical protein
MPDTRKIRWGFLGTAAIADGRYAPAIRASRNGTLHAVASRDPAKARAFAAKHGFARACGSYEELLADPAVDAIYNPLPNALHAPWSIAALRAGKPVLCEKPLAATAAEAREMFAAAATAGLPLLEAFMYRRHPLTRRALELLHTGRIGRLRLVRTIFTSPNSDPGNIRLRADLAGGALRDLGCYCLDLMGLATRAEPTAARALALLHPGGGIDSALCGTLVYPGDVLGEFSCAFNVPYSCSYEFHGTRGRLVVDHGAMVAWPGETFKIKLHTGDTDEEILIPPADHYQFTAEEFADHLLHGTPLQTSPEETLRGLELIDRLLADAGLA